MKINHKKLAKQCGYDPQKIGIVILTALGYRVDTYVFPDSIYIYQKRKGVDKLVYWNC